MKLINKILKLSFIEILIILVLFLFLAFKLIIFLSKAFVYLGFNLFLYTDNLLKFSSVNPLVMWGILGLFIGSIFGVIVAVKKYKLSKRLIIYPIAITFILIILLSFINKPTKVTGSFRSPLFDESITQPPPQKTDRNFSISQDMNVRSGPSVNSNRLFIIPKGAHVTIIENHSDWVKIAYYNPGKGITLTGYVKRKYLN